jgi:bifunctional UDP-N-acetylglucosamine pyrophosphorylase / glucosamine-1-phosphate N-acetyltransferase
MAEPFTVLIMAAGRGTRMRSDVPKVLHRVCGKPMLDWVVDAGREAGAGRIVCVVRPGDGVAEGLPEGVELAEQTDGEGTGAAVLAARAQLEDGAGAVVILSGDHPLVSAEHLSGLMGSHREESATATVLTTENLDPEGYGRIVRDGEGSVARIVETKNPEGVPAEELAIREINLGTYAFDPGALLSALDVVAAQGGERYLTGAIQVMRDRGEHIATHLTHDADGSIGVNDRADLMRAEAVAQTRILESLARDGVTFLQPASTRVEAGVWIGEDTVIGPGVSLVGRTVVGAGAEIGPHTTVTDSRIGDGARVVHSYLVEADVGENATVGPFAYLRPGTVLREGVKVGTFVEIKNSVVGAGAKVPHLSYIGDADVGEGSNLGASTITANYDGRRKHRTNVGSGVKTGIHTSLVAPVDVGDRAYTGAGSVITGDVPEGALGIARAKQRNVDSYADRMEEKDEPKK